MMGTSDLLRELIEAAESRCPAGREGRIRYWGRELARTWSFIMDHEEYYIAYLQDLSHRGCRSAANILMTPVVDKNMHELIDAAIGYFEYARNKQEELRCLNQDGYFRWP